MLKITLKNGKVIRTNQIDYRVYFGQSQNRATAFVDNDGLVTVSFEFNEKSDEFAKIIAAWKEHIKSHAITIDKNEEDLWNGVGGYKDFDFTICEPEEGKGKNKLITVYDGQDRSKHTACYVIVGNHNVGLQNMVDVFSK